MALTAVCSGPKAVRKRAIDALTAAGFTSERHWCHPERPCRESPCAHHWGHSSYPSVEAARKAGKPNAGHTPGTPHPETGKPYAADPRISFLTVVSPVEETAAKSRVLGQAIEVLAPLGWVLRGHWSKTLRLVEVPAPGQSLADRVAAIEAELARGKRS